MTHEPGRDRFISYCCEHCGRRQREPLILHAFNDEYWCESCIDDEIETTYDNM